MQRALGVVVREPKLRRHLEELLDVGGKHIPGRTTLYRHRLTIHMGFCRFLAAMTGSMLRDGGATCFGAIDSSAQGPWDWLLSGRLILRNSDLQPCMQDAHAMINLSISEDSNDDDVAESVRLSRRLQPRLRLVQGAPVGVGSGRGSLSRKLHALVHATRLTTSSWEDAVATMNSTFSWTGDLGT